MNSFGLLPIRFIAISKTTRRLARVAAIVALASTSSVQAQTLGPQYDRLLNNKCAAMGFARDGAGNLAPGQATGAMQIFCNGVASSSDPRVTFISTDWGDPIFLAGPSAIVRITALPGWRDRAVRERLSRRARQRGEIPSETRSNSSFNLAVNPIVVDVSGMDHDSVSNVAASLTAGGSYWVSDHLLGSASGVYRRDGYAAGLSLVWAPSDRTFFEALASYDVSEDSRNREPFVGNPISANRIDMPYPALSAKSTPHIEMVRAEMTGGVDFRVGFLKMGPRFGFTYATTRQSAFSEQSRSDSEMFPATHPLPTALTVEAADESSLQQRVGLNVGLSLGDRRAIAPELELTWLHEYRDQGHVVSARFTDDIRASPTLIRFQSGHRPRNALSARLGWGLSLVPRVSLFCTGEIRNFGSFGRDAFGSVGVRARL